MPLCDEDGDDDYASITRMVSEVLYFVSAPLCYVV